MLKDLHQYENLGTPRIFYELFGEIVRSGHQWSVENISQYFYNRIIDDYRTFDGCIPLAESAGAIVIDEGGIVNINPSLVPMCQNEKVLSESLIKMIMSSHKNDFEFRQIFNEENISYDSVFELIQINMTAFFPKNAAFCHMLVDFKFLSQHPNEHIKKFVINSDYRDFFDKEILPNIKKRKLNLENLYAQMEQNQIYGKEAENFVLEFERKRLASHPNIKSIAIISEYDVAAGYDIISYSSLESRFHDRFIEVKSFISIPYFHWSYNEIEKSRIHKNEYYLYLVDRNHSSEKGYAPIIIKNPYEKIFENQGNWIKTVEGYFITQTKPYRPNVPKLKSNLP